MDVWVRGVGDSHLDVRVDGRPLRVLDASAGWASGRAEDLEAGVHTIRIATRTGAVALRLIDVRRPGRLEALHEVAVLLAVPVASPSSVQYQ